MTKQGCDTSCVGGDPSDRRAHDEVFFRKSQVEFSKKRKKRVVDSALNVLIMGLSVKGEDRLISDVI